MQRSGHPRISLESSKSSKGSVRRESATRRHSWARVTSPTVAPVGTPVELGHLQQAREFLDEIRQDVIGDTDHHAGGILNQSLQGGDLTFSKTQSIGEMPRPEAGKTLMTAVQRSELHRLLRTKGSASEDMDRLAELCCKMHFFKRLTRHQLLEFLAAAEFFEKDTAEIIYRDGDPLGNVYVVLNGSVVIHRALQEDAMGGGARRGHCRAFVSSCFDGRAFGDGWDYHGKQSVRCTTAVAQEKSLLLRLDTETYREVLRKGDICSDHAAALRELPFLQECSANELESLLLMLETVFFHYLSRVLEPLQQPIACHVLKQGRCEIRAFGIEVKELLPGAFFGLGVLLGLNYGAPKGIEIQVSSMTAQFYWIKRKSLLPLPDVVQESILRGVRELVDAQQDPIQEDGREVTRQEHRWRKQKQKSLAEVRRTSGKRKPFKATARVWHPPGQARLSDFHPEVQPAPLKRPASAPAKSRSHGSGSRSPANRLKSKGSGTSLGNSMSSPQGLSPLSENFIARSFSSSRQFSMSRQISAGTPHARQIPAFAEDGRPMAVFGRTNQGFVMLSYPAPLSPLYSQVG